MSIRISITADGTREDVVDFIHSIAQSIEEGETHGTRPDGRSWEIDEYEDELADLHREV